MLLAIRLVPRGNAAVRGAELGPLLRDRLMLVGDRLALLGVCLLALRQLQQREALLHRPAVPLVQLQRHLHHQRGLAALLPRAHGEQLLDARCVALREPSVHRRAHVTLLLRRQLRIGPVVGIELHSASGGKQ